MPYPHPCIKLTEEERKIVNTHLKRYAREGKWKHRRRLQILYFSDIGHRYELITEETKFSYATVRYWIYRYRGEGLKPFICN
jgi:hypothetical protein